MKTIKNLLAAAAAVAGTAAYAVKPNNRRAAAKRFDGLLYAHRGLHGENGPAENSLAAFAAARAGGYGVELDVRLTSDDRVVVCHDDDLTRLCGREGRISELTYAELSEYTLSDGQHIPLFEEALEVLADSPIICELKSSGRMQAHLCKLTMDVVDRFSPVLCIESFDPQVVQWFKVNRPEIVRGQLACRHSFDPKHPDLKKLASGNLVLNFYGKPDFIAYCHTDTDMPGFAACKKLYDPFCVAWTVCSQEELDAAKANFSAFIFEGFIPQSL